MAYPHSCPVHPALFLNVFVFVDVKHPFILLRFCTKSEIKISVFLRLLIKTVSVFVIYDRTHCSVFMKLHNWANALTLISPEQLIATNGLNRKNLVSSKTWYFPSHRISHSSHSTWNLASKEYAFCCYCCSIFVFIRSCAFTPPTFDFVNLHFGEHFKNLFCAVLCVFVRSSVIGFRKMDTFLSIFVQGRNNMNGLSTYCFMSD